MGTAISPEEYLSTSYEWEPEYVRGELQERPMPNFVHAWIVRMLMRLLDGIRPDQLHPVPEVRCKMPNGNYRLPDVALFEGVQPDVPTAPAVVTIEVLSKDEKYAEFDKLQDFEQWGVPHIWVVNPQFHRLEEFRSGSLHAVQALTLPEYGFEVRYEQLVEGLPDA